MSLRAVGLAVTVGMVPPLFVIGAVQMLIWVPSEALKFVSSVKVSPAESVTLAVFPPPAFHVPTSTTRRFPAVTSDGGWTDIPLVDTEAESALACWTNTGGAFVLGVTALLGGEGAAVPAGFEAVTVNV